MGTPHFAVASLNKLIENRYNIAAVVTVPDKPQGRGQILKFSPVKEVALKNNIPVLQPASLKDDDFIQSLKKYKAELYVVVAFRILPESVFTIPEYGTLNVHASLLPKYRGAAPINRAIMNNEKETGVTTMLIDRKVDTGQILMQTKVAISSEMTAGELHDILAVKGAQLLIDTVKSIENNSVKSIPQDDTLATKAPKIKKEDCKLDFSYPAIHLHNQIRGLSPYPAAFCQFRGKILKIFRSLAPEENIACKEPCKPGQIIEVFKDSIAVCCGTNELLNIIEVQPAGKKRMPVKDFINGYQVKIGEIIE